jgi:hypothetical protein
MRFAAPFAILTLIALLLSGCGGSGEGMTSSDTATVGATGAIQTRWEHARDCGRPPGASRWGCSVGLYRCQAVVVDRGWSVSCSRPGESVAFTVRP